MMSTESVHRTAVTAYNEKVVDLYERARPEYVRESVEFILTKLGVLDQSPERELLVLELGAGTGKFTRTMLDFLRGRRVQIISSEPLLAMCKKFRQVLPGVEIRQFAADKIGEY